MTEKYIAGFYEVERDIKAPVQQIWQAWTNADELAAWYGPVGFETPRDSVTTDARVGGTWSATVVVPMDGSKHAFNGEYLIVEPLHKLVFTLDYASEGVPMVLDTDRESEVVTLTFTDLGEAGTHLKFRQDGFLPADQLPLAQAGIESYFDSLEQYLGVSK